MVAGWRWSVPKAVNLKAWFEWEVSDQKAAFHLHCNKEINHSRLTIDTLSGPMKRV